MRPALSTTKRSAKTSRRPRSLHLSGIGGQATLSVASLISNPIAADAAVTLHYQTEVVFQLGITDQQDFTGEFDDAPV